MSGYWREKVAASLLLAGNGRRKVLGTTVGYPSSVGVH